MKACNIMTEIKSLADLKLNDTATVISVNCFGPIRRRLRDMGLIEGTQVKCVLISPPKDPKAYLIRGAVIALRNEDASKISVKADV